SVVDGHGGEGDGVMMLMVMIWFGCGGGGIEGGGCGDVIGGGVAWRWWLL
nr:hypothetical protein [Tanacetum cinerariifolium]